MPDAVVMDRATGTYADYRKVRPIHFEGKYFKVRGPLNTVRSPQGKPVFVQAGGSPRGRAFAARHADSIIATANGIDGMKQYRDDVRRHAVSFGRNPDDIKVLFLVYPTLGRDRRRGARRSASGWCPRRTSSSVRWPAPPPSPTSTFPSTISTSRCRG